MRACPSCGRENPDDRDFCECGEYLRWEPTQYVQAVPPPTPAAPAPEPGNGHEQPVVHQTAVQPPAPAPPAGAASITLRLPDQDAVHGHTLGVGVEPGQRERVLALIRNQSGIVDNYELRVEGLPEGWWSIYPDTVYLVPYGTSGTYEQEVEIHLHPPRSPEAEARLWELRVVGFSKANNVDATSEPLAVAILPYTETATKVRPERAKGRRKADFTVDVANQANAPVLVALEGTDPDGELAFGFDRPPAQITPGQTVQTTMRVRPPKQVWVGRAVDKRFEVKTLTNEEAGERLAAEPQAAPAGPSPTAKRGRLRIPGFSPPQLFKPQLHEPGLQIGPGGINLRQPQLRAPQLRAPQLQARNIQLSNLKGGGGAAAAAPAAPLLPSQGIFRQKAWLPWWLIPILGLLAILGVFLFMLTPKRVEVPKLVGHSATEASQRLAERGLSPAAERRVESRRPPGTVLAQLPRAGTRIDDGGQVRLTISVGRLSRPVPNVVGLSLAAAQRALNDAGFELGQVAPFDADRALRVRFQDPGARRLWRIGTPVDLALGPEAERPSADVTPGPGEGSPAKQPGQDSAANPHTSSDLAFNDARGRVRVRRADGMTRTIASANAGVPAWHRDGRLAFLQGSDETQVRVVWRDPNRNSTEKPLTGAGPYHRPTFSPDGRVLLVIRAEPAEGGAGVLCFEPVPPNGAVPDCQDPDPEWLFARPAWSPSGNEILVLAGRRETGVYSRLVLFRRTGTDGASADAWEPLPTPVHERPQIAFVAWSSSGVAVLEASSSTTTTHLVLFGPEIESRLDDGRAVAGITGCQVAWAPDGRLAVAERGCSETDKDGPINLIDPMRPDEPVATLARSGANPAWAPER